ncbi:MAG: VOC family protein, partial [Bacteroidota bacterium]
HLAIIVSDLERSVAFYENVIGLKQIKNGTGLDHSRWFDLGHGTSLHVIQSDRVEEIELNKLVHLSLTVRNLGDFIDVMRKDHPAVPFENWPGQPDTTNVRPDGITQIYFQDPDGYWIEVNDAMAFR